MQIIEAVGVLAGVLAVYLLYKNKVSTWPIGFVNIGCFMWLFWNEKLYGDFGVQVIFLLSGIFGWINWKTKKHKIPTYLTRSSQIIWGLVTMAIIPFAAYFLINFTKCSFPLAEAAILAISITGQALTTFRKIENWYYWLAADFLMIFVYSQKQLYLTAIYAIVIFCIGVFGVYRWKKLAHAD